MDLYIPLKYFLDIKYIEILKTLSNENNLYIYSPIIIEKNYKKLIKNKLDEVLNNLTIKGIVISNISGLYIFEDYIKNYNLDLIANYSLNVFNNYTVNELKNLSFSRATISPELNKDIISDIVQNSSIKTELIVYGKSLLMTSSNCFLGNSNYCYSDCARYCNSGKSYYLKDRLRI